MGGARGAEDGDVVEDRTESLKKITGLGVEEGMAEAYRRNPPEIVLLSAPLDLLMTEPNLRSLKFCTSCRYAT
jgi:hypothetical protein